MFPRPISLAISIKFLNVRYLSVQSNAKSWKEVAIPVPWGIVRGKWWGATNTRPVLCFHGWQDNCGTFDRLIPELDPKLSYLAIDFPGHGLSTKIPSGLYYYAEDYLILVRYMHHLFKWDKISLMGHSMGGITAYTYSMLYSDCVDFAVCLDGSKPMIWDKKMEKMGSIIDNFIKYAAYQASKKEPPSYTMDQIIQKVCSQHGNSVLPPNAHFLIERNIAPSKENPGKYYLLRDVRIKSGTLVNYPKDDLLEHAARLQSPLIILKTTKGSYYEDKKHFYEVINKIKENNKNFQFHYIDGTHHVHLNYPERVSGLINDFMKKYSAKNRNCDDINPNLIFKE